MVEAVVCLRGIHGGSCCRQGPWRHRRWCPRPIHWSVPVTACHTAPRSAPPCDACCSASMFGDGCGLPGHVCFFGLQGLVRVPPLVCLAQATLTTGR